MKDNSPNGNNIRKKCKFTRKFQEIIEIHDLNIIDIIIRSLTLLLIMMTLKERACEHKADNAQNIPIMVLRS